MEKIILTSKIYDKKIQVDISENTTVFELGATLKIILNSTIKTFSFPEYVKEEDKVNFFLNELQISLDSMNTIANKK